MNTFRLTVTVIFQSRRACQKFDIGQFQWLGPRPPNFGFCFGFEFSGEAIDLGVPP